MSSKVAKLGLSAVLAYGLFDAVTCTSFFVFAFLGYEKSTGTNSAANRSIRGEKCFTLLVGSYEICITMYNVSQYILTCFRYAKI